MPKISKPLTDKEIKSLKPKEKMYKKSDGDKLYIAVYPCGKKVFFMEYLNSLNRISRQTIGNYPNISLKEARDYKNNLKIKQKNEQENKTFKEVALEWWVVKKQRTTEAYFKRQCRYTEMYVFPFFANRNISTITTKDILIVFDKLQERKIYETQKRTFLMTREIFAFARQKEYIESNIMGDIDYSKVYILPKVKHFATLINDNEIKALLQSINEYTGDITTKYALLLSIYTAQRPFNIRSAEWSEFDIENKQWIIPADKMKMREKHLVPLSKQVAKLIQDYKNLGTRSKYLFPSARSDDRQMSDNTVNSALRRMGYTKDEIVAHGFRAMFSTVCNEKREKHGISHDIIELCLAHKERNSIRGAYNRATNIKDRQRLMQWWGDFLDGL